VAVDVVARHQADQRAGVAADYRNAAAAMTARPAQKSVWARV